MTNREFRQCSDVKWCTSIFNKDVKRIRPCYHWSNLGHISGPSVLSPLFIVTECKTLRAQHTHFLFPPFHTPVKDLSYFSPINPSRSSYTIFIPSLLRVLQSAYSALSCSSQNKVTYALLIILTELDSFH